MNPVIFQEIKEFQNIATQVRKNPNANITRLTELELNRYLRGWALNCS